MWNKKLAWSALILTFGITLSGQLLRMGLEAKNKYGRVVSVRGLAERTVPSNEASWNLQFSLTDSDLIKLNAKVKESQKVIQDFLSENGFQGNEVQKEAVRITDRSTEMYENKSSKDRYIARGGFQVSSKKVKELAAISIKTEELMKRGVVPSSSNLRYYFTELNAIKPEMIQEATLNAKQAAQSFATDTGSSLGKIRNAHQGLFSIGAPHSDYDSDGSFLKKIRVVTSVDFFIE